MGVKSSSKLSQLALVSLLILATTHISAEICDAPTDCSSGVDCRNWAKACCKTTPCTAGYYQTGKPSCALFEGSQTGFCSCGFERCTN
ncbi:hypothetical protein SC657_08650 [Legionella pneumophila]